MTVTPLTLTVNYRGQSRDKIRCQLRGPSSARRATSSPLSSPHRLPHLNASLRFSACLTYRSSVIH